MHLLRVKVPKYRALENVDITFEKEFIPRVFPLGSQNGGGKSTLLQLIFTFLHCSSDPERLPYLQNMLEHVQVDPDTSAQVLAEFEIWDGGKVIKMEFFLAKDAFLLNIAKNEGVEGLFSFEALLAEKRLKRIEENIAWLEEDIKTLKRQSKIEEEQVVLHKKQIECEVLKKEMAISIQIIEVLSFEDLFPITNHRVVQQNKTDYLALLCHVQGMGINEAKSFLEDLADSIFLVAPLTQIYLFLAPDERKQLFELREIGISRYNRALDEAKDLLPGFSTYDFFSIKSIIEFFESAKTMDFAEKVKTGSYGNNYDKLFIDINTLLVAKQVSPLPDLSGITFKLNNGNGDMELFPEDLSHGEMKRLIIYSWLKAKQIEDAIVLMDEIEIALHPDWQGQIVADLLEWAGSNQYILATHSLELCQAVTPAHVKELTPILIPRR